MLSTSVKWWLKTEKSWLRSSLRNSRNDGNTTPCRRRGREGGRGEEGQISLGNRAKWSGIAFHDAGPGWRQKEKEEEKEESGGIHSVPLCLSCYKQQSGRRRKVQTGKFYSLKLSWDFLLSIWIANIFPEPASYLPIWIPRQRLINAQHKLRFAHYP